MRTRGKVQDVTVISLSLGVSRSFELRYNWPETAEEDAARRGARNPEVNDMKNVGYLYNIDLIDNVRLKCIWPLLWGVFQCLLQSSCA